MIMHRLTLQDLVHSGVSHVLLHWEVLQVPVPAVQLEGFIGDVVTSVCGKQLGHGTQLSHVWGGGVNGPRCVPHQ